MLGSASQKLSAEGPKEQPVTLEYRGHVEQVLTEVRTKGKGRGGGAGGGGLQKWTSTAIFVDSTCVEIANDIIFVNEDITSAGKLAYELITTQKKKDPPLH